MGKLFRRFWALANRRRLERELEEDMAAHRDMMHAERRHEFGSTLRLREESADVWGWTWLDQLRQDLLYSIRSLRHAPGFAIMAVAVLSLGIGVNLAEIHVFEAVLHRTHVRDVDSLVRMYQATRGGVAQWFSLPAGGFYRRHNTVLAAVISEMEVPALYYGDDAGDLRAAAISGNYFGELGVSPAYGRLVEEHDDEPGAPPVVVLGYGYWQARFGGDPAIVTKLIRLNGKPFRVAGIAAAEFGGLVRQPEDLWIPMAQYGHVTGDTRLAADFTARRMAVVGRLRPGTSRERAQAQLQLLAADMSKEFQDETTAESRLLLEPVETPPNKSPQVILLIGTMILLVLLVLLSACANLGNMLLARGLARQREIEIRLAVGAGRWRVIRQLLTENLLLAALASAASLLVGSAAARLTLRIIGAPPSLRISTDWRIVLACASLGVVATLAFGLAPALQTVRRGPKAARSRKVLVSVQVAVSCVLLIVSTFLMRGIRHSFGSEIHFDYTSMALVDPTFYMHRSTPATARQELLATAARLRRVPEVADVTMATIPPLRRTWIQHVDRQQLYLNAVAPSYFPVMGVRLLSGRIFGPGDGDAVVMVSESAARRLWPNESPLGKAIPIQGRDRTVIGVVIDSGVNLASNSDTVEAYTPIDDRNVVYATLFVRTRIDAAQTTMALRSAATLPGVVPTVLPFQSVLAQRLDAMRKMVTILGSLAGIASGLAMLGIFGLLAFTVAQRTREIGVRMALGARAGDVLHCVLGQYALPFGLGAAAGVLLALACIRVFQSLLYGFLRSDPLSYAAGLAVFAAVALIAAIAPARRALRIDAAAALRWE